MSGGMLSRWPVVVALPVLADECDEEGLLTEAAIERLFAAARSAYFQRCASVDESVVELRASTVRRGDSAPGDRVTISVNVVEVYPETFTMDARVRPADRDGIAATGRCSLSPGGQVSDAMRDEFIALAQGARRPH
jgi:acyl-CoA thioesterase FadM